MVVCVWSKFSIIYVEADQLSSMKVAIKHLTMKEYNCFVENTYPLQPWFAWCNFM